MFRNGSEGRLREPLSDLGRLSHPTEALVPGREVTAREFSGPLFPQ